MSAQLISAPLHPEAEAIVKQFRTSGLPPLVTCAPSEARARGIALAARMPEGDPVARIEELELAGADGPLSARSYVPLGEVGGTTVYFHGGGWVTGTLDLFDPVCRCLAASSGTQVISVDYRLAPEAPFPAAVDDAWAALVWAGDHLGGPLAVAGDSSGANLATVAARRARDAGAPAVVLQVLAYPALDGLMDTPSYETYGAAGLPVGRAEMEWYWNHYLPDRDRRADPDASPLHAADLAGMPPAHIVVAEHDPLRDEIVAYAERLADAGTPVELRHYPDMLHGFFTLLPFVSAGRRAVVDAGDAIREAMR
jgi:acetyl esterase